MDLDEFKHNIWIQLRAPNYIGCDYLYTSLEPAIVNDLYEYDNITDIHVQLYMYGRIIAYWVENDDYEHDFEFSVPDYIILDYLYNSFGPGTVN